MPKILLVEDDPFIAEIYLKKLTSSGFEVENVTNGREVLKRVSEKVYDLALLDLVLPEMSGFDILREIKGKPAEYPQAPKIVVFSNLSSADDRAQAVQAGADGFISKTDFTPTQVIDEVRRFLLLFSEQAKNATRSATPSGEMLGQSEDSAMRRILLAEDEDIFIEMFGKRLTDEGYLVLSEKDGRKVLERMKNEHFDLLITDIMLPGLTGVELIQEIRAVAQTKDFPIFVITASLDEEGLKKLGETHVIQNMFIKTKITPTELTQAVNEFFKSRN